MSPVAPPVGADDTFKMTRPRPRSRKRRILLWLLGLLTSLILLLIVAILFRNPLLRSLAEYSIARRTGLRTEIRSMNVGFRSASLTLKGFALANPPGFGDMPFIEIPELHIQMDSARSVGNTIAFEEIRFHLARLGIVRNRSGELNVNALTNAPAFDDSKDDTPDSAPSFGGIGKLTLTVGHVSYTDLGRPELSTETPINLHTETTAIRSARDLTNWVGGLITRVALQQYFKESGDPLWKRLLEADPPRISPP